MSQKRSKPKNRPTLSNPLKNGPPSSFQRLTSFHPSKPLFAVATTAIGQHVLRIYNTERPVPGAQEVQCEIQLKKGEKVSFITWMVYDGKKRKRAEESAVGGVGELVVGLTNGQIYLVEQASGEIVKTFNAHTAKVRDWSMDGQKAWTCGDDGKIKCWDPRTGSCLLILAPDTDTSEYTALIVSKDFLAVASLQNLFLLGLQSGDILSQVTAHTTPIRTIRFSPRLDVLATAAVGDRFIAVFSTEDNKLERIGSLTCTHDVQNFIIQDEILLAITVLGTLEVFHSFHANFEPGKKGGLTKAPSAEISLTTPHNAPIEIVDVVPRGNETMISWLEGVKIGFQRIDIQSISGKVGLDIQTRQEQTQQQTSKPYDESTAAVYIGTNPPTTLTNGTTAAEVSELSFADRLSQLHPPQQPPPTTALTVIPSASSLSTILTQALNSSDETLLQQCFQQSHSREVIHNTLVRLSPALVPGLLSYFNSLLSRKQKRVSGTLDWIRETVVIHGGYLVSQGMEVRQILEMLRGTLDRRAQRWERLVRLKGRLELLRALKGQESGRSRNEPEVRWIEDEEKEEEEPEVEDVRYLTGGDADEDELEEEVEEVEMENGVDLEDEDVEEEDEEADEEEDEDEDEEEEEEDEEDEEDEAEDQRVNATKKVKVNGTSHFSDSEDSALDLNDLIDDEAEEASEDEEDMEEDDDEEEEESESPPPKKSRR